ncbi:pilus assembly protein [Corallococcus sp. H22C18031201]|nr:pilus assembly protein [Corallococcus sp. H22C18031201]
MNARSREGGQAAVETAIVLPLFVFLILGTLQLSLMHQARLMTKYAAYKAVRAGSIHSANVAQMEKAALGVLLPMLSKSSGGAEYIKTVTSGTDFAAKFTWPEVNRNLMPDTGMKYAVVTICGPTTQTAGLSGGGEYDFDDPKNTANDDWDQGQRTKLRVQVTFNYRMPIPFADMVLFNLARARELPSVLRLGKTPQKERAFKKFEQYDAAARNRHYILPIRATYTMRMQSNFFLSKNPLPKDNECVFTWN